ncbi:hypothetical protein BDV36DRAFT_15235 [Aspergillus pseudocaelatus]|uniref:BTB domain-containing protein n=1 Tax=Aspergillus pseudocaelatus TaxID=1825620 RepID=A0ABQ6WAG6_9EURO|nr:hypothetical protein BDV36DRAFT_15235 [Aspergillus pseudocaelatus]
MTMENGVTFLEFLTSDFVSLQALNSTRVFKVHKALLDAKCKAVASAFNGNFTERQNGVYTFSDTSEGTLSRFLEWAYRGDYTEPVVKRKDTASDKIKKDHASNQLESLDYPLMAHMALYIFSEVYIVPNLKDLVFAKIKAAIEVINKPRTEDDQRGVISLLKLAYTMIPANKSSADLQEWLAHYAAFSLEELRGQPSFNDVLKLSPDLASKILSRSNPADSPPWPRGWGEHKRLNGGWL